MDSIASGSNISTDYEMFSLYLNSEPIAVLSYTDAKGEITPLRFKYKDSTGEIYSVTDLYVYQSHKDQHNKLFWCKITEHNIQKEILIFYIIAETKWCLYTGRRR